MIYKTMQKITDNTLFAYTAEGYKKAQQFLKDIGEWGRVSTFGFSIDGWSIVQSANVIKQKMIDEGVSVIK